jgi:hypothetical protein
MDDRWREIIHLVLETIENKIHNSIYSNNLLIEYNHYFQNNFTFNLDPKICNTIKWGIFHKLENRGLYEKQL